MKKIKTYNIMLSKVFPVTHKRAGEPTLFSRKVRAAKYPTVYPDEVPKLHTIRANCPLWEKRIAEVQAGNAEICLRQWTGKPYRSKTVEIMRLTADDGVGLQKLRFTVDVDCSRVALIDGISLPSLRVLANNDGLSLDDWNDWFRGYDGSKPMAIIHFTSFRY